MLTAPEFHLETEISPQRKVIITDGAFKAPRNLYYGELEPIDGCMLMFLIDK